MVLTQTLRAMGAMQCHPMERVQHAYPVQPTLALGNTCAVCLHELHVPEFQHGGTPVAVSGTDATYTLPCGHTLHVACAVHALTAQKRCPMCRAPWNGVPTPPTVINVFDFTANPDVAQPTGTANLSRLFPPAPEPIAQGRVTVDARILESAATSPAAHVPAFPMPVSTTMSPTTVEPRRAIARSGRTPYIHAVLTPQLPAFIEYTPHTVLYLGNVKCRPLWDNHRAITVELTMAQGLAVSVLTECCIVCTTAYVHVRYVDDNASLGPKCLTINPGGWWQTHPRDVVGTCSIAVSFDDDGRVWLRAIGHDHSTFLSSLQRSTRATNTRRRVQRRFLVPPLVERVVPVPDLARADLHNRNTALYLENVVVLNEARVRGREIVILILTMQQFAAVRTVTAEGCHEPNHTIQVHANLSDDVRDRCLMWCGLESRWRRTTADDVHCSRSNTISVALSFNEDGIVLRAVCRVEDGESMYHALYDKLPIYGITSTADHRTVPVV